MKNRTKRKVHVISSQRWHLRWCVSFREITLPHVLYKLKSILMKLYEREKHLSFLVNERFWPIKKLFWVHVKRKDIMIKDFSEPFPFLAALWTFSPRAESFTMTEMCRMRSSSLAESLAGSSVGSGRFEPPSWWWMWKSRVPFSSHCCLQRTRGMSSELPEISARHQTKEEAKWVNPNNSNHFNDFCLLEIL